jgi:hypothetical protein
VYAIKKTVFLPILFVVVQLAVGLLAYAQQAGKVPRIGFLDNSTAAGSAGLLEVFWQEMRKLGWIEGKTSPSSIGLPSKSLSTYLSLPQS